jgi:cytochrome P450
MAEHSFTQRARAAASQGIQIGAIRALTLRERVETGAWWNPFDERHVLNPYPTYQRLREKDPIHRSRLFNGWIITRYEDAHELLRNSSLSADDRNHRDYAKARKAQADAGVVPADEVPDVSLLRLDPPDHTRLRTLVSKAFTPRSVEALRPRVEGLVEEMVGGMGSHADVISELAVPLPVVVICEMLGIPTEDRAQFKLWSNEITRTLGLSTMDDLRAARKAQAELDAYLAPIVEERRRQPREDLLSALVRAEEEGDRLTMGEVYQTVSLLLVAGNETTTSLIGNGLLALMRNPGEMRKLRDDPSLIPNAVEELLRFDSPVQLTSRIVMEDFEFRGVPIHKGQDLNVILGAANRDPEVFANPDTLDVTRKDVKHLSFSQGMHYCLGAPLARLEATIAFTALLERFATIERDGKAKRGRNIILRGIKYLPVRLERN